MKITPFGINSQLNSKTAKFNLVNLKSVTFALGATDGVIVELFFWKTEKVVYLVQLKQDAIALHYSNDGGVSWNWFWTK